MFNEGEATGPDDRRVASRFRLRKLRPQVLRDFIFYFAIAKNVLQNRVRADVLHVHGDWSAFVFGRLVGWLVGARLRVASIHSVVGQGLWGAVYRLVLKRYAIVYATGARESKTLGSYGVGGSHWQTSGVDVMFFPVDEEKKRSPSVDIVSVGSFLPVKNWDLIVDIARSMSEASFLFVGDGPDRARIEAACKASGLQNVRFVGGLTPSAVSDCLREAKVFLSTSFAEGTPTALLEAMASGLAVVTSSSNDYCDLIAAGRNGYVVETFQSEQYVERLRELLADEVLLRDISARNSEHARKHSWPEVAARITGWMRTTEHE